jgi:hypothetical protein
VSVAALVAEASQLTSGSIQLARRIDHASSGERLGRIVRVTMEENRRAYGTVRVAVEEQVRSLGGAGRSLGLFRLAADMATTAAIGGDQLSRSDRRQLRRLWDDLRTQG